ncbi:MAG TPA: radical SAM protein [Candidatus Methanofastidiosa archaeon]|nr:radical SAM protein [Candidatus Methanofastidiosa archaeon]
MKEIKKTKSLCPECLKVIDASIYEKDGKVIIEKKCDEHGLFSDTYWSDYDYYMKAMSYRNEGIGLDNPQTETEVGCPYDCGLCGNHLTSTLLANIDITNRCNMRCPICFANAAAAGYVLELSMEEVTAILTRLAEERPVRCWAVQFSGGEPTVRDDFPDIVAKAREMGFTQIQVATNGKRFVKDIEFIKRLKAAGISTFYLQFDGVTEKPYITARGYNALPEKIKALENLRKEGMTSIVLVPTLVKGVSDGQVGDIVRFAFDNSDIVKGVNFQPVSFAGRIDKSELEKMRITIPDLARLLEEQTDGQITKDDLYPVPCIAPISNFISKWKKEPQLTFTCHEHCGVGTYLFKHEGKILPITRFVDVDGLFEYLEGMAENLDESNGKIAKAMMTVKLTKNLPKFIDGQKAPPGINLRNLLLNILSNGTVGDTAAFHRNTLFLGAMHFMDPYNFDIERVKRCGIHYGLPDGRIIPFCSYNSIHRPNFEKEFGIPLEEWRKKNAAEKDVEG